MNAIAGIPLNLIGAVATWQPHHARLYGVTSTVTEPVYALPSDPFTVN
jgi:hypothetical protein